MKQTQSSVWEYKPWWCQPWSILLTGIGLIVGSWLLFHRYWVTAIIAVSVLLWMGFFLLLYPKLIAQAGQLKDNLEPPSFEDLPKI